MSIRSFQDFHSLNEGKKLKDWQYTGTVSVGSNNAIYYQYPNNVKYYVSVTPEELEDYSEGGSLKKKLEKQWADSGKAMTRDEFEAKYLPKGPQGLGKYLSQGGRMWDHVEHNDLNEADTWTVYYKKGSFGREVVKSGLSKQAATRLYNKLSADIPSEYDGVEMVMEAASDAQIRKVMKLAKNRPAPFAVVAVKGGKVVAQDIDIKTWELVLAHYREMAKAHPDAKIHVEDAEGQSVMESVNEAGTIAKGAYSFADYFGIPVSRLKGFKFDGTDDIEELHKALGRASSNIKGTENIYRASITESADMLPSYEVLIGLATVMGALDLAQAAKGGDSIILDVAKALKAELGDKLEAAGAEAKRVVSKFKNDPKVKEIIMDAEEEVSESKRSTAMKISLFEEYFNEAKSDITPGSRVEVTGQSIGNMNKTLQGEVTRKNSNGTYEVSLDNGDMADYKADELRLIESVNEARPNFNQLAYISSAEYQKVKKLKNFNAADWKWDSKKDLYKNVRIEESVNEATETGLMVVPRTNVDANKIKQWVDKSGMYGEWNAREGYFLFPEEEDGFDELEMELTKELDGLGVNYHIEGVFESNKSKQKDMTKIKLFENYFNEGAPSPRHFTSPDYVGPEFAKKASDEDIQLLVKLKGEKLKMHDKHVRPIEDQIAKLMKKYGIKGIDESINEAASGDLIEKMDKALEDFEETLGDLEFYWGQLSIAADKIGKAMAGGDDSKEMRQAWYRASMAQRNAAKKAMRMLK